MANSVSLHKLMIEGSKERKSLSGAIKTSQSTSINFWKQVSDKIKNTEVTPKWIAETGSPILKRTDKKTAEISDRSVWSAWLVEKIVVAWYNSK